MCNLSLMRFYKSGRKPLVALMPGGTNFRSCHESWTKARVGGRESGLRITSTHAPLHPRYPHIPKVAQRGRHAFYCRRNFGFLFLFWPSCDCRRRCHTGVGSFRRGHPWVCACISVHPRRPDRRSRPRHADRRSRLETKKSPSSLGERDEGYSSWCHPFSGAGHLSGRSSQSFPVYCAGNTPARGCLLRTS